MENRLLPYWESRGKGLGENRNTKNCPDGDRPVSAIQNGISCSAIKQDSKNEMDSMKRIIRYKHASG